MIFTNKNKNKRLSTMSEEIRHNQNSVVQPLLTGNFHTILLEIFSNFLNCA